MNYPRTLLVLQLLALWFAVISLALITGIAFIASFTRTDCTMAPTSTNSSLGPVLEIDTCTPQEHVSTLMHHHASYFQSAHIILLQAIAACCLLLFRRSLLAMVWAALKSSDLSSISSTRTGPTMTMATLQNGVELVNSPGLIPAALYAIASHSIMFPVLFVAFISFWAIMSPVLVSPIYRPHTGPYSTTASIDVGGGVGPVISESFNLNDLVAGGTITGRSLINARTSLGISVTPVVFDPSVAPFLTKASVDAIWNAQVQTVVARNSIDCGASAPLRLANNAQDLVTIDMTDYFAPNQVLYTVEASFAGQMLGRIIADPVVTAVYLNSTSTVVPGSVEAQTSIVFLAANGTMENAQHRITSPEPTSRIAFVDVLVCTSTTRLEMSMCTIDRGAVTGCDLLRPAELPTNATTSPTGAVETYITGPLSVATILSASAVTAFYNREGELPAYGFMPDFFTYQLPPLPFLTADVTSTGYNISLAYLTNALFHQTAQGLVQGFLSAWPIITKQKMLLVTTFGTSEPILLCTILAFSTVLALIATLANTLPTARHAPALDVVRLISISRNPQLDDVLETYADRDDGTDDDVLKRRVAYRWIESLQRSALMLGPRVHTERNESSRLEETFQKLIG